MAQTRYTTWKSAVDSFPLGQQNIGIIKPGRFNGFDTKVTVSGNTFKLTHAGDIRKTLANGTPENSFGALVMPTGIIIHDTGEPQLTYTDNLETGTRTDLVICEHNYAQTPGGVTATYAIITGPVGGARPAVPNPEKQVIIGQLQISGTAESPFQSWTPEAPPLPGDNDITSFYNNYIATAVINYIAGLNHIESVVTSGVGVSLINEVLNNDVYLREPHSSNNSVSINGAGGSLNFTVNAAWLQTQLGLVNPQVEITGDRTLVDSDSGSTLYVDPSGGDINITIDGDLASTFNIAIVQTESGNINFLTSNSGVILKKTGLLNLLAIKWGTVYIEKRATTTKDFLLTGDLSTL